MLFRHTKIYLDSHSESGVNQASYVLSQLSQNTLLTELNELAELIITSCLNTVILLVNTTGI